MKVSATFISQLMSNNTTKMTEASNEINGYLNFFLKFVMMELFEILHYCSFEKSKIVYLCIIANNISHRSYCQNFLIFFRKSKITEVSSGSEFIIISCVEFEDDC